MKSHQRKLCRLSIALAVLFSPSGYFTTFGAVPLLQFHNFEDALLAALTGKIQSSQALGKPVEILDKPPNYMSPNLRGLSLSIGESSRMIVVLATPPSDFAVKGKPSIWISPFENLSYALQVHSTTDLGQRLKQFLEMAKTTSLNQEVISRICVVLSDGSPKDMFKIINRINAEDRKEMEMQRNNLNKMK